MSLKFQNFFYGVGLVPNATDVNAKKGDLNVTSGNGKLNYHNGTSSSPVVTEGHQATLSLKTLDAPIINDATADTITAIAGGNLALYSDVANSYDVLINDIAFSDANITAPNTLLIDTVTGDLTLSTPDALTLVSNSDTLNSPRLVLNDTHVNILNAGIKFGEDPSSLVIEKSPTQSLPYTITLPQDPPTANTALVYDGSNFVWGSSGTGGGQDGGLGDDLITTTYLASITDDFTDTTYSTVNGSRTNAIYNETDFLYTIAFDKLVGSSTGTTVNLTSAAHFAASFNDVIIYGNQVRTIVGVTSQTQFTINSAFSPNIPSGSNIVVSRAFYSKDVYNQSFGGNPLSDAFDTSFSEVLVDYEDADHGSAIFNLSNSPLIGYSISQDGISWSDVYTRPTSPLTEVDSVNFSAAGDNLYVRFFAIDGTDIDVNLLKYKTYMQKIATESNGGILNFAYANTNGAGNEVNCTVGLINSKTAVTLNWQYAVGIESLNSSPYGSIDVYLDGKLVPRYIDSTTTPGPYYTELTPYIVQFDADYTSSAFRIEILRRTAVIYSENAVNSATLEALTVDLLAGETLAPGQAVYISTGTGGDTGRTAGRAYLAHASNDDRINFIGFATNPVAAGGTVTVQVAGEIIGLTGLTTGQQLFVSEITPGALTNVAPSAVNQWVVPVGIASSASKLVINSAGGSTAVKITSEIVDGLYADVQTYSVSTTLTNANSVVLVNAAGGSRTMTLPTPATNRGKIFNIKKIDASLNTVIIAPPVGVTIDGTSTKTLNYTYDSLMIVSNGTNYFLI